MSDRPGRFARMPASLLALGASFMASAGALAAPPAPDTLMRVRLDVADAPALAERLERDGFDVLEGSVGAESLELVVSPPARDALVRRGLFPVVVEYGRPFAEIQRERGEFEDDVPPGYPDLAAVLAQMNAAAANYPAICRVVDLTTTLGVSPTFEGRSMYALKISDNVEQEEDEPVFLLAACHHAREIITPVIALHAIQQLTAGYGSDPRVTAAVNEYEIYVAPVWNPDGYHYVFTVNNLWRKNRRNFGSAVGVDLNRNYPLGWSAPCSGSTNPASDTYKGPSPASEAETQTMIALSQARRPAKVLDYHSYGNEALWEYNCLTHPWAGFLQSEAIALSNASGYGGANRAPSAEGEHQEWQMADRGAHAFLIETASSFQPPYSAAQAEAARVWPGILWMLERPISLSGHVRDAETQTPLAAQISFVGVTFNNGERFASGGPFGSYHLVLPPGTHQVRFAASGYVAQTHPVTVTATSRQTLDVQLPRLCCVGDVNCDRRVDQADLGGLLAAYGTQQGDPQYNPDADFNHDGRIDQADLGMLLAVYGRTCP